MGLFFTVFHSVRILPRFSSGQQAFQPGWSTAECWSIRFKRRSWRVVSWYFQTFALFALLDVALLTSASFAYILGNDLQIYGYSNMSIVPGYVKSGSLAETGKKFYTFQSFANNRQEKNIFRNITARYHALCCGPCSKCGIIFPHSAASHYSSFEFLWWPFLGWAFVRLHTLHRHLCSIQRQITPIQNHKHFYFAAIIFVQLPWLGLLLCVYIYFFCFCFCLCLFVNTTRTLAKKGFTVLARMSYDSFS